MSVQDRTLVTENLAATGGQSTQQEVESENAETLDVTVDNGTGSAAGSYSIVVEVWDAIAEVWLPHETTGSNTAFHHQYDAVPYRMRVQVTNESASSGDYRIRTVTS